MRDTRTTDFSPARFLAGPHAQTIYANLLRRIGPLQTYRERLELEDGDFLDVDVAPAGPGSPWVLVLHGLEGSSQAPYVRGLARALVARGIEACLLNYRGCSGEDNRLLRSYHSGETKDVLVAWQRLAATRASRACGLAGFSIGANLTMKLLGEMGEAAPPFELAVAISPPFDLAPTAKHLDRLAGFVYRERLLATLRQKALAKIVRFPGVVSDRDVRRARTFTDFDERFTAPVHGFANAAEYWAKSSGGRYLDGVARDLLIVAAEDDPFFPPGYVPLALRNERKMGTVELVLARGGGHVGFVSGSAFAPRFWAEELAASRLQAALTGVRSPA
ncbi:MAG TPA: alpha/beta fold hydrolase [Planctomycetota bacterium]|nr:alpha/beta fold hydrolase [Planctomycetota bacterium]